MLLHNLVGQLQHLGRRLGVQGGGVLIQKEDLGLFQGGHEQGQGLPLSAGKQPHLGGEPVLQPQSQGAEQLFELLPLAFPDAPAEGALLPPAGGQSQVLLDGHVARRPHHGVLEPPAQIDGPPVLGQLSDVHAVNADGALVHRPHAGDGVEHGGLARPVSANDGDEVPLLQGERQMVQRRLLVNGAGVEGLTDLMQFKHGCSSCSKRDLWAVRRRIRSGGGFSRPNSPSSREWPGRWPPPGRRSASCRWCSDPCG